MVWAAMIGSHHPGQPEFARHLGVLFDGVNRIATKNRLGRIALIPPHTVVTVDMVISCEPSRFGLQGDWHKQH